jgi:hypothetical protein
MTFLISFLVKKNPFSFLNGKKIFKIEGMAKISENLSGRRLF